MPKIHSIVHRQTWYYSEMQWLLYPLLLFLPTCYLPSPLLLMNPRMDFCTFIFSSTYMSNVCSLGNDPSCILKNADRDATWHCKALFLRAVSPFILTVFYSAWIPSSLNPLMLLIVFIFVFAMGLLSVLFQSALVVSILLPTLPVPTPFCDPLSFQLAHRFPHCLGTFPAPGAAHATHFFEGFPE